MNAGFLNALSLLLARDGKVALGEVIRSQWSLSDWWNKCYNNQLMNSSLRCPLPLTLYLLDVQMRDLTARTTALCVTQIWQITLTRISDRRNESCCQVLGPLPSEWLKMQSPAELTFERREQSCYVSISLLRWEIASKLLCCDGTKRVKNLHGNKVNIWPSAIWPVFQCVYCVCGVQLQSWPRKCLIAACF